MSECRVSLFFGDGVYDFFLGLAQIKELQRARDAGIGTIMARVLKGSVPLEREQLEIDDDGMIVGAAAIGHNGYGEYYAEDLIETIRQGLMGALEGNVDGIPVKITPQRVNELIRAYVIGKPLRDAWTLARVILFVCIEGYVPKKKGSEEAESEAMKTDGSITPERSQAAQ